MERMDTQSTNASAAYRQAAHFVLHLLVGVLFMTFQTFGQTFEENFAYTSGSALTANGWTSIGSGSAALVHSSGLTYTGYASTSGNAAALAGANDDVSRGIGIAISSGDVYASFLLNVTDAPTGAVANSHRIFALGEASASASAEVFASEVTATTFSLSVRKNGFGFATTVGTYNYGTTYLVVLKYGFNSGVNPNPILNDNVSLFVFTDPALPASEPGSPDAGPIGDGINIDANDIEFVSLWQEDAAQDHIIDGIRIDADWNDAPLPVSLTAFYALSQENSVQVHWETASEVNNDMFILKRGLSRDQLVTIAEIPGQGTTNIRHEYSYNDIGLVDGTTYYYQLVDRDINGILTHHSIIEAVAGAPEIKSFSLLPNFPNPFNPETNIRFEISADPQVGYEDVDLQIYNSLGQQVRSMFSGRLNTGLYTFKWDGRDNHGLAQPSGIYFLRLSSGTNVQTIQMSLLK